MERTILLILVITAQAIFDVLDGTAQLIDSIVGIDQPITFQPITCKLLREFGAKGKTKQQMILSLA